MEYIKISIITVSYNAVKTIEQTISSVVNQTYNNIEYIIIDGGSKDGTVDIIRKYEDKISYWVSEPDKGIYDAMNKGIEIATGDYVYFLGADDWLFSNKTITEVADCADERQEVDFLCGKVMQIDQELVLKRETDNSLTYDEILSGSMCHHQGTFTKSYLAKKFLFDSHYKITADFEFFIKCITQGASFSTIPVLVAYFKLGGMSSVRSRKIKIALFDEIKSILMKYSDKLHLKIFMKQYRKNIIKIYLEDILNTIGLKKIIKRYRGWQDIY